MAKSHQGMCVAKNEGSRVGSISLSRVYRIAYFSRVESSTRQHLNFFEGWAAADQTEGAKSVPPFLDCSANTKVYRLIHEKLHRQLHFCISLSANSWAAADQTEGAKSVPPFLDCSANTKVYRLIHEKLHRQLHFCISLSANNYNESSHPILPDFQLRHGQFVERLGQLFGRLGQFVDRWCGRYDPGTRHCLQGNEYECWV
ncbi:uncharacterized protein LOC5520198 [Nematostella vectensis]|uniref:uncharacterized protein LOC5520198 n=1 Tax=Nematostella vectensis TaxID=45351 RepID=UPI0020773F16|nr:uncharacterized protein LOC5520198 [Nematostella vectensis]